MQKKAALVQPMCSGLFLQKKLMQTNEMPEKVFVEKAVQLAGAPYIWASLIERPL
jgi:hypothetical protein